MALAGKLTDEQRTYVVTQLATFSSPTEVQKEVKELYGVEISLQGLQHYDPYTNGSKCAEEWKLIFDRAREEFIASTARIGIAHQSYRIRELQRLLKGCGSNRVLAAQILKQAAEEIGGAYTNRRELSGKDGGPMTIETFLLGAVTPEKGGEGE